MDKEREVPITSAKTEHERVKPIIIKDPETEEVKYIIEFTRETVEQAQRAGFVVDEVLTYPAVRPYEFFFYAMKAHQAWITPKRAREVFDDLGGIFNTALMERLFELYNEPARAMKEAAEMGEKNGRKYVLDM